MDNSREQYERAWRERRDGETRAMLASGASDEFAAGVFAAFAYLFNTGGTKFAEQMFPDSHPSYQQEYADAYYKCPQRAIGRLDDAHLLKLAQLVHAHSGAYGREHVRRARQKAVP